MAEGHFTIQIFTDSICCIICNIALFDNSQITNYKWYKIHLTQMLNLFHWCSDFAIHSSLQCTAFIIFTFIHLLCQILPAVPYLEFIVCVSLLCFSVSLPHTLLKSCSVPQWYWRISLCPGFVERFSHCGVQADHLSPGTPIPIINASLDYFLKHWNKLKLRSFRSTFL